MLVEPFLTRASQTFRHFTWAVLPWPTHAQPHRIREARRASAGESGSRQAHVPVFYVHQVTSWMPCSMT